MDLRQTFGTPQELVAILTTLQAENADVSLLVDSEGLLRVSGKITAINGSIHQQGATVSINNGALFLLSEIVAVNGIFRSDYSEC